MSLFGNENAVTAKASGAPPRTPLEELSDLYQTPITDVIVCTVIRAGYCILYEQFSHKCYSLKKVF